MLSAWRNKRPTTSNTNNAKFASKQWQHWQMATVLHLVLAEQPIQLGWVFFEPNIQNAALSYGFRLEQIQVCNNVVAYILFYTYTYMYKYVDRFTVAQLSLIFPVCTFNFCGCWCNRWSLSRWSVQKTHWPQIGFEQFSTALLFVYCGISVYASHWTVQNRADKQDKAVSRDEWTSWMYTLNVNMMNV